MEIVSRLLFVATLLLNTSLLFPDDNVTYITGPYRTFGDAVVAFQKYNAECNVYTNRTTPLQSDFSNAQGEYLRLYPSLKHEFDQHLQDKDTAIDELKKGLRCSRCKKTQKELGGPQAFYAHLGTVDGVPLPPTPEEIAEKEAFYDDKIKRTWDRIRNLGDKVSQSEKKLDEVKSLRQRACELANIARLASIQLQSVEDQQNDFDAHRKSQSSQGPYHCKDFKQETETRKNQRKKDLQRCESLMAENQGDIQTMLLEKSRLDENIKSETDFNKRQILSQTMRSYDLRIHLSSQSIQKVNRTGFTGGWFA